MGKKDKNKKKGLGAEKTALKTDKKAIAKQKKLLTKLGEDDIEKIVQKYEVKTTKIAVVSEQLCAPPSARVNFSLCSHPDKEELLFYGGEFFNGQKTYVYQDFYTYNIPKNEWKLLTSPTCPAPRSGHQMVPVQTDGGQIWLFGGEYASPSQSQFYHYKDLWVYRVANKHWEKVSAANGPSARSGHRMVASKKKLFVFGGFHDNNTSYKYFNDLYIFELENYTWIKVEPTGNIPPVRSGCCMVANNEGKILVWGGYSKSNVKREVDRGVTHADMFSLAQDKHDPKVWKWSSVKPGGKRPPPRSGMSVAVAANGKAYAFGGVMDTKEDDEDVEGQFSHEILSLDIAGNSWRSVEMASKKEKKVKSSGDEQMIEEAQKASVVSDGVFTMVVGGSSSKSASTSKGEVDEELYLNGPSPRMNSGIVICKGNLYIFGGLFEKGHRQYTLSDFYSLDLNKLDSWKTLIANSLSGCEWMGSDSEGSSSDEDDDDDDDDEEEDSDATDTESSDMDTD